MHRFSCQLGHFCETIHKVFYNSIYSEIFNTDSIKGNCPLQLFFPLDLSILPHFQLKLKAMKKYQPLF